MTIQIALSDNLTIGLRAREEEGATETADGFGQK